MIQAEEFVEAARNIGFGWYSGVPCSFLTPFINYVINDVQLRYISAANEGDAVAIAAGAAIAGKPAVVMMQNSGLGNAINPLTSLTYIFRIPLLLICTLRGDRLLQDEPQHELMGQITEKLLETMTVPWEYFPTDAAEIEPVLQRATAYMQQERRPYALIMRKGSISPHTLIRSSIPKREDNNTHIYQSFFRDRRVSRSEALARIVELIDAENTVIIATTGYTGRELFASKDSANHLYMVGSMGCASSMGLGLSLARPDLKVVVIDGDGAALMRMGNFATIGTYGGANLTHILLDNEVHDSTGAQATVSAGISFAKIAEACGYGLIFAGDDPALLDALFTADINTRPKFAHLKIRPGTLEKLPRPNLTPEAVLQRFMKHIGSEL
ncbi:phosphonopyruvate decarboxylase [Nostoc sp. 'Peltigera membranacea cyanobiont' 213]|uniref:phosphonopyruvate decarboxylase n=1 Tax=Nostoc sp. 'Peltigera membranacea cyanobiont' 213 TaxID=2014530 RepID=UPI000B9529AC|nr:phosphonopyruvate decarboxylase [Nostoc sp. 'Peltigera membranacea cyanobiont' 213]OYD89850.1 phosphonopyruvate decarboxylase [Nostoc sp. 'Peltigera membranacea cyanobiont' 213]